MIKKTVETNDLHTRSDLCEDCIDVYVASDVDALLQSNAATSNEIVAKLNAKIETMRAALMDAIEWADECIPKDVYQRIKDAASTG